MWMHSRLSENLWLLFCVKIYGFVCRVFFPAPNINDFPICHSKPLNQSGMLPSWNGFEVMGLADLFMAVTWVINHVEWSFAESGKLFMIDGNGPAWRKKQLRRNQILIWKPTHLYELEMLVTNFSFSSSIYLLQLYSRRKSSEWWMDMI